MTTLEDRLILRSPLIVCMLEGIVTGLKDADWMMILPLTVWQVERASRSLWLLIVNPVVLVHVELPVCANYSQFRYS